MSLSDWFGIAATAAPPVDSGKIKPLSNPSQETLQAVIRYIDHPLEAGTRSAAFDLLMKECVAAQQRDLSEAEMRYIEISADLFLTAQIREHIR